MNMTKTQKSMIVERDDEGRVMGGIIFWWSEGSSHYFYQEWEHCASGAVYDEVKPDPISGNLISTIEKCWLEQMGMEFYDLNNKVEIIR